MGLRWWTLIDKLALSSLDLDVFAKIDYCRHANKQVWRVENF